MNAILHPPVERNVPEIKNNRSAYASDYAAEEAYKRKVRAANEETT